MFKFVYIDNNKPERPIIHQTIKLNILEADKEFQEKTGIDPRKVPTIGCQIHSEQGNNNGSAT